MRIKYLDKVRVLKDNENYKKSNVFAGDVGVVWLPEIRDNTFYVMFENGEQDFDKLDCVETCIKIEDLELVEDYGLTNEQIAESLPSDELWWCVVEDGFIKNIKGEKKNKIPFDYDS